MKVFLLSKLFSFVNFKGKSTKYTKQNNILQQQKLCFLEKKRQKHLPDGELNPGLPRDRRGYLPLYYRGWYRENERNLELWITLTFSPAHVAKEMHRDETWRTSQYLHVRCIEKRKINKKNSLEPDSNQWPKDICVFPLQSSALPTELSRDSCLKVQLRRYLNLIYKVNLVLPDSSDAYWPKPNWSLSGCGLCNT